MTFLLRHENVFPFSTSLAAFEVRQLAALVLGPIHNLGDQNYHFVTGALDKEPERGCDSKCLFTSLVGTADSLVRPVSRDKRKTLRPRVPNVPSPFGIRIELPLA